MKILSAIFFFAFAIFTFTSSLQAEQIKFGNLVLENPTLRPTPPNAPVSGGYLTIQNTGKDDDRLLGGSVEFARKMEVHEMLMDGDVMQMRKIQGGLKIPAGTTVTLQPGGKHLMMIKLDQQLKVGQKHMVTLKFEKAGEIAIEFMVKQIKRKTMMNHSTQSSDGSNN